MFQAACIEISTETGANETFPKKLWFKQIDNKFFNGKSTGAAERSIQQLRVVKNRSRVSRQILP